MPGVPRRESQASNLQKSATAAAKRAWRNLSLGLAAALLAATGAQAQSAFGPVPVGTNSGEQSVTVTAQAAGTVSSVEVLTQGASGMDFARGTSALCKGVILTVGGPNGSCAQSVTFTPTNPGLRMGAVVLLDSSGNVLGATYISGTGLGGLGVLAPGNVLPVAGNGNYLGSVQDGKLATSAELYLPSSVVLDGAGNIYIADSSHNRIRMVCNPNAPTVTVTIMGATCSGSGFISTVAGNGNPADTGDGKLASDPSVTLNNPSGVALDGAGNLYIADTGNNAIRKITAATGIITTVAGTGAPGYTADNVAATSSADRKSVV
jgi:hypothetical protein